MLDGIPAQQVAPQIQREQFAWLSQSPYLFNTSLRDNLQLAKTDATQAEMLDSLTKAGLTDWLAVQPDGFDTWVGEGGVHLSAGERQRLAIARMLLQPAGFLLLDEPIANLDPEHRLGVLDALRGEAARGAAVVVALHDLDLAAARCDRLLLLDGGRLIADGPPDAVLTAATLAQVFKVRRAETGWQRA